MPDARLAALRPDPGESSPVRITPPLAASPFCPQLALELADREVFSVDRLSDLTFVFFSPFPGSFNFFSQDRVEQDHISVYPFPYLTFPLLCLFSSLAPHVESGFPKVVNRHPNLSNTLTPSTLRPLVVCLFLLIRDWPFFLRPRQACSFFLFPDDAILLLETSTPERGRIVF